MSVIEFTSSTHFQLPVLHNIIVTEHTSKLQGYLLAGCMNIVFQNLKQPENQL